MTVQFPWHSLSDWSIVGMHHYMVGEERHLFVSLQMGKLCITEQGKDDQYLWNRLWHKAHEVTKPVPKAMYHVYPSIELIQTAVAAHFRIRQLDLVGPVKTRFFVRPRMIAMHLARELTDWSCPEIGTQFGGRDHTTVLNAWRRIDADLREDRSLRHVIETLKGRLKPQLLELEL